MKIVAFISTVNTINNVAVKGMLAISVDNKVLVVSDSAAHLAHVLQASGVKAICTEEGFENDSDAQALLNKAVDLAYSDQEA
jgi:hypothetical protein